MHSPTLPLAVSLPGQLWLVAAVLVWPLGAWVVTAVRGVPGTARSRVFGRTALVATAVAVALLALAALLFATNGTTRGFQALGAQLAAAASLVGGLLSGGIALVSRRTGHGSDDAAQPCDEGPAPRRSDGRHPGVDPGT